VTTLAICIPTYRRPALLKQCVLSAVASAQGRPVSIFIADDSMSEINRPVLDEFKAAYPFVNWMRNPVNLGIDQNIRHVLSLSDCDYSWMIGEDDIFLPGAVAAMYDLLQVRTEPYVFANYQYVTEDHSKVLGAALPDIAEGVHDVPSFIANNLWAVGFLGSCVFRRDALSATSGEAYRSTYFTHVGRVLDILGGEAHMYVSAQPAIANRAQGDDTFTWKQDSFGVFLGFERMCAIAADANANLSAAIRIAASNYRRKFAYFSLKTSFRLRSEGAFDLRQYNVYIKQLELEPWRKAWLFTLALSPRLLIRPFARLYIAARSKP